MTLVIRLTLGHGPAEVLNAQRVNLAMYFSLRIKHQDIRVTGKPGTLGSPRSLNVTTVEDANL